MGWQESINVLAQRFPGSLTSLADPAVPVIGEPIDLGASVLLGPLTQAWISYPPLEVEYLLRTVNDHIRSCLELRERAQELEARAITDVTDRSLQLELLDIIEQLAELGRQNEPLLLGNLKGATLNDSAVQGTANDQYWQSLLDLQKRHIDSQKDGIRLRLEQMKEEGSGANYVARFKAIKARFDVEFKEAYKRALTVNVGLKAIYGLDCPVPSLTDIAFLDALAAWAQETTYRLEQRLFVRRDTTIAFQLNTQGEDLPAVFTDQEFGVGRNNFLFQVSFNESFFNRLGVSLKNPRLRGVAAAAYKADNSATEPQAWRVRLDLPEQQIPIPGALAWSLQPVVLLPMVGYTSFESPLADVPPMREVHNVNPLGTWEIRIEQHDHIGSRGTNSSDTFDRMIIFMRVAFDE